MNERSGIHTAIAVEELRKVGKKTCDCYKSEK